MGWDLEGAIQRRIAVQDASLDDFDSELPVSLTTFVQDKRYLGNPPLSDVQYEAVRYAERVYLPETYTLLGSVDDPEIALYWSAPYRMVNFLTMQWGKGSGKDHISRIASLRVAYLLLCLKSPQAYFRMPEQDTINLLNVATSSGQANRAFFTPMRRAVSRPGNWFQDISEAVEIVGKRRDPAKPLMNVIKFDKNVEAVSGHSDADSQEGLNLIFGVADEVDGFKSRHELETARGRQMRESPSSAESILDMLRTSASTRFPKTYKVVRISYPRYLGSTIQKLTAEAKLDNTQKGNASRHYVSGPLCTWDVNPRVKRDDFAEDYEKDAALAQARYECRPSRAVNPYFGNEEALRAATREVPRQPVIITEYAMDGAAWFPVYNFAPDFKPLAGAQYAIHADLSVKGDRAGVAMSHVKRWDELRIIGTGERGEDVQLTETRPFVRNDFVISFEADAGAHPVREIQLRWYRMLVLELRRRGFNIRLASADGFQSTDTMQILQAHGIETKIFSTDKTEQHWVSLRDTAYENRLEMPAREVTIIELLGLSRLPNGKIDHLGESSKDEADALACSISGALELGGAEDPDGLLAWPGGDLTDWSGPSHAFEDMMPIGFARPRGLLPVGLDFPGVPYENTPQLRAELDPNGLPRLWMPDAFANDPLGCPCSMGDGIPRCRECKAQSVRSI